MATGGTENADSYDDAVAGRIHVLCHPCGRRQKNTTATSVCLTCQEHLCDECCEPHRVFKPGEHHISTISSLDKIQTPVDMKGMDTCAEHGRVFRYHCKDHDVLCCELCHIEMHKFCRNIFDINDLLTDVETIEIRQTLESTLLQANEIIEQSDANVKAITNRVENVSQYIDNMKQQIEQEEERAGTARSVRTEINDVMALNKNIQAKGTGLQKYIVKIILARKQVSSLSRVKYLIENNADNTVLFKEEGTQTAEISTRDVACDTVHTADASLASGSGTDQDCASESANKNIKESPATKDKHPVPVHAANEIIKLLALSTDRFKKKRGDKEWPYISSLDFLSDGRIVAIDNHNERCLILGPNLQRLGSYHFDTAPFGVTCFGNDQLAVTLSEPSIVLLSTDKNNHIKLTKTISLPSYMHVDNITPFYNGSFVLSTYDDNMPVRIVDINGIYTFFHGIEFPQTWYEIGTCQCTFIASHNILVFTDYNKNIVCLFNTQTGETVKVTDSKIEKPIGVCEGPNGSILVACVSTIVQLTTRGEVLTCAGVGMRHLQAIKVSKNSMQLAVSSTTRGNCQLRLFKILK